jgi:hypothetical protein
VLATSKPCGVAGGLRCTTVKSWTHGVFPPVRSLRDKEAVSDPHHEHCCRCGKSQPSPRQRIGFARRSIPRQNLRDWHMSQLVHGQTEIISQSLRLHCLHFLPTYVALASTIQNAVHSTSLSFTTEQFYSNCAPLFCFQIFLLRCRINLPVLLQ